MNEIVWKRQTSNNAVVRSYGRIADYLLFYAKGKDWTWNQVYHEMSDAERKEYKTAPDGRLYKCENLTTPGARPERQFTWRGATPSASRSWARTEDELEAMLARGEIELRADGRAKLRGWVRFLDESDGQKAQTIWTDILRVGNTAKERVGYPTQKPLALLERIIKASSNPGDVVLDPFCGCATACVAAERVALQEGQGKREWVGIDISPKAAELVRSRLQNEVGMFWQGAHREDVPVRTDLGDLPPYNADVNKRTLYGQQEGQCNGCLTLFPYRNLTVDHVVPRQHGGGHHIGNLQLLCGACNSTKGTGTQEELVAKLIAQGVRT